MAIEVPQNEEISGGGRKGIGSAIRWGGANRGAYTLRKGSEEQLFSEMLIPKAKRGGRKFREDRSCLMKMTTPSLACVISGERMPDRRESGYDQNAEQRIQESGKRSLYWIPECR